MHDGHFKHFCVTFQQYASKQAYGKKYKIKNYHHQTSIILKKDNHWKMAAEEVIINGHNPNKQYSDHSKIALDIQGTIAWPGKKTREEHSSF